MAGESACWTESQHCVSGPGAEVGVAVARTATEARAMKSLENIFVEDCWLR